MANFYDDLLAMMSPDQFGTVIELPGLNRTIAGIYDTGPVLTQEGMATVLGHTNRVLCRDIDVADVEQGEEVVINNTTFHVASIRSEEPQTTTLYLHKL